MIKLSHMDLSLLPPALLGKLSFSIAAPKQSALSHGCNELGIANERDATLYVPSSIKMGEPVPLLVMFHGARGWPDKTLSHLEQQAEQHGFLLLVPYSQFQTWDLAMGGNGPDLARLEQALTIVSDHFQIDSHHFGFAGFSDGGSYALSIGLTNGQLVSHVIALSPGFMSLYAPEGAPQILIAHGTQDEQLPAHAHGGKIASKLQADGYAVKYEAFEGGHIIRAQVLEEAIRFFLENESET